MTLAAFVSASRVPTQSVLQKDQSCFKHLRSPRLIYKAAKQYLLPEFILAHRLCTSIPG